MLTVLAEADEVSLARDLARPLYKWDLKKMRLAFGETSGAIRAYPIGAQILPGGDLLVINGHQLKSLEIKSSLVRLDKDGNVKWHFESFEIHHWFTISENKIYVPFRLKKSELSEASYELCGGGSVLHDGVGVFDLETGQALESFSVLNALANHTLLRNVRKNCPDPLCLNAVRVLTAFEAKNFPIAKTGDYLLSLANLDSLVLLDQATKQVKWSLQGQFRYPHSPQFNSLGNLVFFDNLGGKTEGKSRILEIVPSSRENRGRYVGSPNHYFQNPLRGHISIAENDYFITSSEQGEIFTLSCRSPHLDSSCAFRLRMRDDRKIIMAEFYTDRRLRSLMGSLLPAGPSSLAGEPR